MRRKRGKSPLDIFDILIEIQKSGCILIGGQAINVWSLTLQIPNQEPWHSLKPFTSLDVDAFGNGDDFLTLNKTLLAHGYKTEIALPSTPGEKRINTGAIRIKRGRMEIGMNVLKSALGVNPAEIKQTTQRILFEKQPIDILHPLLCLEGKARCLMELPQRDRQDEKHLKLAVANLNRFFEQQTDKPDDILRLAQRIPGLAVHDLGQSILAAHNIDVLDAIPWESWKSSLHPGIAAFGHELPAIREEIINNKERERELKDWVRRLKEGSDGPSRH